MNINIDTNNMSSIGMIFNYCIKSKVLYQNKICIFNAIKY